MKRHERGKREKRRKKAKYVQDKENKNHSWMGVEMEKGTAYKQAHHAMHLYRKSQREVRSNPIRTKWRARLES